MPLFCVHCHDRPDSAARRAEHYPAHRAYLADGAAHGVRIAASGPLVSEDGANAIGSLFIIEAADMAQAKAFNAADPFAKAGLWRTAEVTRFDLRRGSVG